MIEKIKKILGTIKDLHGYKILETITDSNELFFVKKNLDMNRAKKVHHFKVTVYKKFMAEEKEYLGSSTAMLHPTMEEAEIETALQDSFFSAGFVKNEFYPLAKPVKEIPATIKNEFSKNPLSYWMPILTNAIYEKDTNETGGINSTEVFLNHSTYHIINSEGVDISFEGYAGEVEFITNWKEDGEETELYRDIKFANLNPSLITDVVEKTLIMSREKALATPTPALGSFTVLLTGEPVKELFSYYLTEASAQAVYDGISTAKLEEHIQGKEVKGDLLTLTLDPMLEGSVVSAPYDEDGTPLSKVALYEKGILKQYWGALRHSHYLNVPPTGIIRNMVVEGGTQSSDQFKIEPYLELVTFSDFQLNSLTGDFAGEIRLGWYFDGKTTRPVTSGSISGNIKEVQQEMYFSKELQKENDFIGPNTVKLLHVSVAGN